MVELDGWSSRHWTDDSWTPDAVATPSNLANHPTHAVLDLGCTRSIGSRSAIERYKKHEWYHGMTTEFCCCSESFVFANSETEICMESCIVHFPATPPCSAKVDVRETGDVPILFSFSQMKSLGTTFELKTKATKLHVLHNRTRILRINQ